MGSDQTISSAAPLPMEQENLSGTNQNLVITNVDNPTSPQSVPGQPIQQVAPSLNFNAFGDSPLVVVCPNCKNTVTTIVTTNVSLLGIGLSCLTLGTINLVKTCRGKGFCCNNADHICPHCQHHIAHYDFVSGTSPGGGIQNNESSIKNISTQEQIISNNNTDIV